MTINSDQDATKQSGNYTVKQYPVLNTPEDLIKSLRNVIEKLMATNAYHRNYICRILSVKYTFDGGIVQKLRGPGAPCG